MNYIRTESVLFTRLGKIISGSLQRKLTLLFTLLISVIVLFIALYFPSKVEERVISSLMYHAHATSRVAATAVAPSVYGNLPRLHDEVEQILRYNPDILYAVVSNDKGEIIALAHHPRYGTDSLDLSRTSSVSCNGDMCRVYGAIEYEGAVVGWLYIGFSLREIHQNIAQDRGTMIFLSIVLLVFGAVVASAINMVIIAPLRKMASVFEQTSGMDLSQRLDISAHDEVGQLAAAFNVMAERLQNAHLHLEEINRNLELRVEERTAKLSDEIEINRKVSTELQKSEDKFRKLLKNAPIAVTRFLRSNEVYEFVNDEFTRQSGYTLDEFNALSGQELMNMIHPDDQNRLFEFYSVWEHAGYPLSEHIEYRIINRAGEVLWLDTYLYADFDEKGNLIAINQICLDITEERRVAAALADALHEDFRRTISNVQNIIFKMRKTDAGKFVYTLVEGKLSEDRGLLSESPAGREYSDVWSKTNSTSETDFYERAFCGESVAFERQVNDRWLYVTLEPVTENGKVTEIVGSSVEITRQKRVEQALKESEERYLHLINSLPVGVLQTQIALPQSVAADTTIVFMNEKFTQITGYTIEEFKELQRKEGDKVLRSEDRAKYREWYESESSDVFHLTYPFRHKSGATLWFESYILKVERKAASIELLQVVIEVTDRVRAEAELARLASFPEQLSKPVIEIAISDEISYCNHSALHAFPFLKQKGSRHPIIQDILFDRNLLQEKGETFSSKEISVGETFFEQTMYFFPETGLTRIFYYDITSRKRAEEELQNALIKEREINTLRTRFVSTISHEFRTPLTGIIMSAQMIQRYGERMSSTARNEELVKIQRRVTELTELMDDFLIQSSVQTMSEKWNPAIMDFAELCRTAIADTQYIAAFSGVQIDVVIEENIPMIIGDQRLLRHVVRNLLSNAVKYSPEQKAVTLSLRTMDNALELRVLDRGIGIPDEDITNLFTPFYRATNAAKIPGTGLGLSIVKEFVEIHGGNVAVKSKQGEGTTFIIRIPLPTQER